MITSSGSRYTTLGRLGVGLRVDQGVGLTVDLGVGLTMGLGVGLTMGLGVCLLLVGVNLG